MVARRIERRRRAAMSARSVFARSVGLIGIFAFFVTLRYGHDLAHLGSVYNRLQGLEKFLPSAPEHLVCSARSTRQIAIVLKNRSAMICAKSARPAHDAARDGAGRSGMAS